MKYLQLLAEVNTPLEANTPADESSPSAPEVFQ